MSSTIIPTLRYENAPKMIDWLCEVLGFERQLVVEDGEGGIEHAQLTLGTGMIMLGSARDDEFGRLQATPASLGKTTQSPYLVLGDIDAICQRARAAGADVTMEPRDEDYGGRHCSFRDPEGHLWNIGSYDPWAKRP